MQYRRLYIPGGSYFFTVVTYDRREIFTNKEQVELLREAFREVMKKRPFTIDAAVILPDHLHCIWTLPDEDHDFSTRWRLIKTWFTKNCPPELRKPRDSSRKRKKQQTIWQHRFWEHLIRNDQDYQQHFDYIHYNPVKHKYVKNVRDWPYSSFHHYVQQGIYNQHWNTEITELHQKRTENRRSG